MRGSIDGRAAGMKSPPARPQKKNRSAIQGRRGGLSPLLPQSHTPLFATLCALGWQIESRFVSWTDLPSLTSPPNPCRMARRRSSTIGCGSRLPGILSDSRRHSFLATGAAAPAGSMRQFFGELVYRTNTAATRGTELSLGRWRRTRRSFTADVSVFVAHLPGKPFGAVK